MKLPEVVADLVKAQNNFDSAAYANCFSDTATVADEGHTFTGRTEIQQWIEKANTTYRAVMKPVEYTGAAGTLKAEVSGNFPGSPIVLTYHFTWNDELIESLKITG